jgi:Ni/Co efflux regulator RcnB
MSDGREEREEQEQRRKWEKERKDREDDLDRDWERDGERERRDSRAADKCSAIIFLAGDGALVKEELPAVVAEGPQGGAVGDGD